MIDALLYSVRDALRNVNDGIVNNALRLDHRTCEIMPDGHPKPNCGDVFVAVHQGASSSTADNCLDEKFAFSVTLTMRCSNVPLDRVGDQLLAKRTAKEIGFNRRAEQLRAFLHMNWGILQDANTYLVTMFQGDGFPELSYRPDAVDPDLTRNQMENASVYGFCEPARYRGEEIPSFVGAEWFHAEEDATDIGLKAELRFEDARRFQPMTTFV